MHSTKRKTKEQFVKEANEVHNGKYSYENCEYVNNLTKVTITCPKHGDFEQTPKQHLNGQGCPKCGMELLKRKRNTSGAMDSRRRKKIAKGRAEKKYCGKLPQNTEEFINLAREIHGEKYDYSKTIYQNNNKQVIITCPKHGDFMIKPYSHLSCCGCQACGRETRAAKQRFTNEEFIGYLKEIYGNEYDYSLVDYRGAKSKIKLICHKIDKSTGKEHGVFEKISNDLLHKNTGCPKCNIEKKKQILSSTTEEFIEKANRIFHGLYTYELVNYINNTTKVLITCRKHGPFPCTPQNHLHGRGCPVCKIEKYVYENRLYEFLKTFLRENEIIRQYSPEWLTNHKSIDFYIPKYNVAIEHQGSQHYKISSYDRGDKSKLEKRQTNDSDKYNECCQHGVILLYFTYELKKKPENCQYDLIFDEDELKNKILSMEEVHDHEDGYYISKSVSRRNINIYKK